MISISGPIVQSRAKLAEQEARMSLLRGMASNRMTNEQKEELVKMEMYELKKDNVNLKIKLRNHEEREKRRRECQEKILSSNKGEFTRSRSFSNNEKQNAINRIIIKPKIEEDMYENISNFRRSKSLSYRLKPMPEIKDDMYETMC